MIDFSQKCERCGAPATHFCTACGKWLCHRMSCQARSAARALVEHPVRSIQVVRNHLFDAASRFK